MTTNDEPGIDITGIDKAELLAALHNATQSIGLGKRHDTGPMTHEEAAQIIMARLGGDFGDDYSLRNIDTASNVYEDLKPSTLYFDYVKGRPLKVDIAGREIDALAVRLFDRDAPGGPGTVARVVAELKAKLRKPESEP